MLRVQPPATLGGLRSHYERALITGRDAALRPDETRVAFAERLLALGQWELPGSQCTPNRVLGQALAQLLPSYLLTLIDHEAGVEHIGRFSEVPIDRLIIVATPEALSLDVAGRVLEHARAVGRPVYSAVLLLNRVQPGDLDDPVVGEALARLEGAGLPLVAALPESPGLRACSRTGRGPLALDAADPWRLELEAALPALLGHHRQR